MAGLIEKLGLKGKEKKGEKKDTRNRAQRRRDEKWDRTGETRMRGMMAEIQHKARRNANHKRIEARHERNRQASAKRREAKKQENIARDKAMKEEHARRKAQS